MTDDYAPRSWHGRQIRRQKMLALLAELAETGEPIPRGWDLVAMTGFSCADTARQAIRRLRDSGMIRIEYAPDPVQHHLTRRYVAWVKGYGGRKAA